MSLHPAEIANEIRSYPFFSSFDESLLLQISTMVREAQFPAGTILIEAGKSNNKLFFLRSGIIQIMVGGEKVGEIKSKGDVIGEMSVLSGNPASAETLAQTDILCFIISADDFAHVHPGQKDRFQYLLYKIYSGVLSDRLLKTNEKAKLYEITARELQQKKRELEMVSSAQVNFLRAEASPNRKTVLLVESNKKQQSIIKTAIASAGVNLSLASTEEEAKNGLIDSPDILLVEEKMSGILKFAHDFGYRGEMVLIAEQKMNFDTLLSLPFVNTVISRSPDLRAETIKSVLTCLSKILHKNYFGPEKYLSWGTEIYLQKVTSSKDRALLKEQMANQLKQMGVRSSMLDRIQVAAEELLMNSIYDAPTGSDGKSLYNHLPRTTEVHLNNSQQAQFKFGYDGNLIAVSIQDPFGALPKEIIIKYLHSCYSDQAGSLNQEKGGAGRGLHQIIESSDWTIFNVKKGATTEVICLFEVEQKEDSLPHFQVYMVS